MTSIKNNAILGLALLMITLSTGCSSSIDDQGNDSSESILEDSSETQKEDQELTENTKDREEYVLVSDIEFVEPRIEEPDSIGTRYFKSQIKNNSEYVIIGFYR